MFDDPEYCKTVLEIYIRTLNRIDDYFEYRYESTVDKCFVREVLNAHTHELVSAAKMRRIMNNDS